MQLLELTCDGVETCQWRASGDQDCNFYTANEMTDAEFGDIEQVLMAMLEYIKSWRLGSPHGVCWMVCFQPSTARLRSAFAAFDGY
jgi:hypothetical protein